MSKRPVLVAMGMLLSISPLTRVSFAETNAPVPKVGDHVEAIDINQKWVNATVVKVEGTKLFVQFEGKTEYWNDWVTADRYRVPGATGHAPQQPAGKRVEALDFNTRWTDATVLQVDGQKSLVHFDGKSAYWDQWVGPERIRPAGTANALALQHPAPEQPGQKGLSGWVVGTRGSAQNVYQCTFYWFQPDGRIFVSDRMPKGWADITFDQLQNADASHCGTYGVNGQQMTLQLNGGPPKMLTLGAEVIGDGIRQPAWAFAPGQRLEGVYTFDATSNAGGVSVVASDSWYFHADGTFKRVKVAGARTDDVKAGRDPHPGKATTGGDTTTEGRYEFVNGRLRLSYGSNQTETFSCFATGKPQAPLLLGIGDIQYKASTATNR